MHQEFAAIVENKPIAYLFGADDPVLHVFSDTPQSLQWQLDGLNVFYANSLSYILSYNADLILSMVLL